MPGRDLSVDDGEYIQDILSGLYKYPPPGENAEFDRYCQQMDLEGLPASAMEEMRRAAWATWKTEAPVAGSSSRHLAVDNDDEDVELARAIALSHQEHSSRASPVLDDDDEELRRAIELSKQPPEPRRRSQTPDEERRQLAEALKASMATDAGPSTHTNGSASKRSPSPAPPPVVVPRAGILGDRARMERERIERQAALQNRPRHPFRNVGPATSDAAGEYFLDGEMRHCAIEMRAESDEKVFTAQEVFGRKNEITFFMLSFYCQNEDWTKSILPDPAIVPTIIIKPAPGDRPEWQGKCTAEPTSMSVNCFPKMPDVYGVPHMKFAWIFYKTGRLRIVIMTANMMPYDFDMIENTIFIQDFLPIEDPAKMSTNVKHDFPLQFRHLFRHLRIPKALNFLLNQHDYGKQVPFAPDRDFEEMGKYDWSRVKIQLVMSIPGKYDGVEEMDKMGVCRLRSILNQRGWRPSAEEKLAVEYQGSSLGAYTIDWLDTFYQFCLGKSIESLRGRMKAASWAPFKIMFPTLATVDASIAGRPGGGTMFVGSSWKAVTKHLFHDANSKSGGFLMHTKMLIGIFEPKGKTAGSLTSSFPASNGKRKADELESSNSDIGGWVYVGSHNFTAGAWGTVNVKKPTPSLHIRNYELGFVFPLPRNNTQAVASLIAPYQRPPRPYTPKDEPWDQRHMPPE